MEQSIAIFKKYQMRNVELSTDFTQSVPVVLLTVLFKILEPSRQKTDIVASA